MTKNAITWIREDFRIENNPALSFATQNHDNVIALYIYNNNDFDNKRESQKWWVFKSLETLKKELSELKDCIEKSRTRIDSIRLIWKGEMTQLNQLANS